MQYMEAEDAVNWAASLAAHFNCTGSPQDIDKCMMAKDADQLVYPSWPVQRVPGNTYWFDPAFPWSFTVDGTADGVKEPPMKLLREGRFNRVPLIFGTNANEFQCGCKADTSILDCLFGNTLPQIMGTADVTFDDNGTRAVLQKMMDRHLTDSEFKNVLNLYPPTEFRSAGDRFSQMMVDSFRFIGHCSSHQGATHMLASNHEDVWMFLFDHPGTVGLTGHASEIGYVFQRCEAEACQGESEVEAAAVSHVFATGFVGLARDGHPGQGWERLKARNAVLKIGGSQGPELISGFRAAQCDLWSRLDVDLAMGDTVGAATPVLAV